MGILSNYLTFNTQLITLHGDAIHYQEQYRQWLQMTIGSLKDVSLKEARDKLKE